MPFKISDQINAWLVEVAVMVRSALDLSASHVLILAFNATWSLSKWESGDVWIFLGRWACKNETVSKSRKFHWGETLVRRRRAKATRITGNLQIISDTEKGKNREAKGEIFCLKRGFGEEDVRVMGWLWKRVKQERTRQTAVVLP